MDAALLDANIISSWAAGLPIGDFSSLQKK
jgi:hypothetical protein